MEERERHAEDQKSAWFIQVLTTQGSDAAKSFIAALDGGAGDEPDPVAEEAEFNMVSLHWHVRQHAPEIPPDVLAQMPAAGL